MWAWYTDNRDLWGTVILQGIIYCTGTGSQIADQLTSKSTEGCVIKDAVSVLSNSFWESALTQTKMATVKTLACSWHSGRMDVVISNHANRKLGGRRWLSLGSQANKDRLSTGAHGRLPKVLRLFPLTFTAYRSPGWLGDYFARTETPWVWAHLSHSLIFCPHISPLGNSHSFLKVSPTLSAYGVKVFSLSKT